MISWFDALVLCCGAVVQSCRAAAAPWFSDYYYCTASLMFCAVSNPARSMSEIPDGEDPLQCFRQETRLNASHRSAIQQKQFIIIIIIIVRKHYLNKIRNNYHIILMESDNISTKKISLERS